MKKRSSELTEIEEQNLINFCNDPDVFEERDYLCNECYYKKQCENISLVYSLLEMVADKKDFEIELHPNHVDRKFNQLHVAYRETFKPKNNHLTDGLVDGIVFDKTTQEPQQIIIHPYDPSDLFQGYTPGGTLIDSQEMEYDKRLDEEIKLYQIERQSIERQSIERQSIERQSIDRNLSPEVDRIIRIDNWIASVKESYIGDWDQVRKVTDWETKKVSLVDDEGNLISKFEG